MPYRVSPNPAWETRRSAEIARRKGPLSENRPLVVVGAAGDQNFGGVRIDGLISHAFLKRYVWTIDFDAHEFTFAERGGSQ